MPLLPCHPTEPHDLRAPEPEVLTPPDVLLFREVETAVSRDEAAPKPECQSQVAAGGGDDEFRELDLSQASELSEAPPRALW